MLQVKHKRTSLKGAGPDPSKIQAADWNDTHDIIDSVTGLPFTGSGTLVPVGTILDFVGITLPPGWLECYGQVISAAAYPALFAALVKSAVVTISIGNPAVVSWAAHGRSVGDYVGFQPAGALPGGITTADLQLYRIISAGFAAGSFRISLTWEGAPIATTAGGSGPITGLHAPFGVSTGLGSFAVPDFRSKVLAGISNMGGANSALLASGYSMGSDAGAETVALTVPNLPAHDHTIGALVGATAGAVQVRGSGSASATGPGLGTAVPVNKMQPTEFVRKIIYAGV